MTDTVDKALSLDDELIERHARQIIVPGVGAVGQARLCAASVAVVGDGHGASAASAYLEAAGMRVSRAPFSRAVDCVVVVDAARVGAASDLPPCSPEAPVAWYSLSATRLFGGLTTANDASANYGRGLEFELRDTALDVALHRIGGADAAGMIVGALLGWIAPGERHELALPRPAPSRLDQPLGGVGTASERS